MSPARPTTAGSLATLGLLLGLGACNDPASSPVSDEAAAARRAAPDALRFYGPPVRVGAGLARTYILLDRTDRESPLEVGVALSEKALEGLPSVTAAAKAMAGGGHHSTNVQLLELPRQNTTPYRLVELDWNPAGHEPPGVYDLPHFDFHFYTIPLSERNSIVPTDSRFAEKAASLPAEEFRPPFYVDGATAAGAPAAAVTVPQMGLHWVDIHSPELQNLVGNPGGFRPFTATLLLGSWDGRFVFAEPMITRSYLLAKRDPTSGVAPDEVIPLPTAQRYTPAGYYPHAYRIAYDAAAHEFLVGLTQLAPHN